MGRTKRPVVGDTAHIRIAAYLRLSKADGEDGKEESNSISMQRSLIEAYISSHFTDCQITEYKDDGFSGSNFDRPGVQKLLADARNEKLDCVIVKDFSRFGRDYMEVGAYLEQIFPFLGVRFISINDCYDSADGRGRLPELDINFKNLLYDLYSKDLAQKVKTSLRVKKEGGQYVSAGAPFGYEKSRDDRHLLVVCEEEAAVVRRIFGLARRGLTSYQTARILNLENVPTPVEFKIKKGKTSRKPKGERFYWSGSTVYNILHNPVYAGDMVYGKTEKEQVGGRSVPKKRADWKVIKDHHAPIIAREEFEEMQRSKGKNRPKRRREAHRHPLAGLAVCGCCGHSLQIREGLSPYFTCRNRFVGGQEACVDKANVVFLEKVVLFRLESCLEEQHPAAEAAASRQNEFRKGRAALQRKMERAQRTYERLRQENSENYRAYALGAEKEFHSLRAQMKRQQEVIRGLQEQTAQMDGQIHEAASVSFTVEDAGRYIDKIVVYSETEIEIVWKLH